MDYIRTVVSGKKNRYVKNGFNLDLTYVCPRLIAMAFPAGGLEGIYRNPIDTVQLYPIKQNDKVVEVIEQKHKTNYKVFNLSCRTYDQSKFRNNVIAFEWLDHHAPPLNVLFHICRQIDEYLEENILNVAVIHCLAGKGRTGTIICCYLIYIGRIKSVEQALEYYSRKRFHAAGLGVNQPCQLRYVDYFHRILNGEKIYPSLKFITKITFIGKPKFNIDGGCKPNIKVYQQKNQAKIYNHKKETNLLKFADEDVHILKPLFPIPVCGDIQIDFINHGMIKSEKLMRHSFNTAFIGNNSCTVRLQKKDIDPSKVLKDPRFPPDFMLYIQYDDACNCGNTTPFESRCYICSVQVNQEQLSWDIILKVLENRPIRTIQQQQVLLFGDPVFDDIDEILDISEEQYTIITRRFSQKIQIHPKYLDNNQESNNQSQENEQKQFA